MPLTHLNEVQRRTHIHEEIEILKDEPRDINWIERWIAQAVGYEPECLDAILAELNEGGVLEQLRALRGNDIVQIRNAEQHANTDIERMLMRIVLKCEDLAFLERARKAGWISWSAAFSVGMVIRLNNWLCSKHHEKTQTA